MITTCVFPQGRCRCPLGMMHLNIEGCARPGLDAAWCAVVWCGVVWCGESTQLCMEGWNSKTIGRVDGMHIYIFFFVFNNVNNASLRIICHPSGTLNKNK